MPIKYSFIIPTFNRADDLTNLLTDLDRVAGRSGADFEVCAFNDGRNLTTEKLLQQNRTYPIRYLFSENRAHSCKSRNACLREVQGEWVIFLDDDVRLREDLLEQVEKYSNRYQAFSFGLELPNRKDRPLPMNLLLERIIPGRVLPLFGHFVGGFDRYYDHDVQVDHLPGANMIFKRSLLRGIFFDEDIGTGTGYLDDADFSHTVKKQNGVELWYIPSYSIIHLQTPAGGNRQLDRGEWFYYYQNHKFKFFAKHFASFYRPFIIFFNFLEAVIRSIIYRKNLMPTFFRALRNA